MRVYPLAALADRRADRDGSLDPRYPDDGAAAAD
jgi:hypothetical protein